MTDAVNVVGDRYSLPIVRELLYGNGRFSDLVKLLGAPRTLLATRLKMLEEVGLVTRHPYSEHPPRFEYRLTEAGLELLPVLIALKEWGDRHCGYARPSARLKFGHVCGAPLRTEMVCAECRQPVRFQELVVTGPVRPSGSAVAKRARPLRRGA